MANPLHFDISKYISDDNQKTDLLGMAVLQHFNLDHLLTDSELNSQLESQELWATVKTLCTAKFGSFRDALISIVEIKNPIMIEIIGYCNNWPLKYKSQLDAESTQQDVLAQLSAFLYDIVLNPDFDNDKVWTEIYNEALKFEGNTYE